MRIIIDRFENNLAVCETEDGDFINLNLNIFPKNAKEGDSFDINNGKAILVNSDERKNKINSLIDELFE